MKAVVSVAPFLEPRALGHVLRAFATLQRDEEPAIRARRPTALSAFPAAASARGPLLCAWRVLGRVHGLLSA